MSNRIIICEASEILTTGLYDILQGIAGCDVVARIDSPEPIEEKIIACDANVLIINPNLLGHTDRNMPSQLVKEHPQLCVIALVTTYIESYLLKPYNAIIELNDSKLKIINKISQIERNSNKTEKKRGCGALETRNRRVSGRGQRHDEQGNCRPDEHLHPHSHLTSQKHHAQDRHQIGVGSHRLCVVEQLD